MQAQVQPEKSHQDDPEFRRLEAVESARAPSFLIRAQMQLQAQQKTTSTTISEGVVSP